MDATTLLPLLREVFGHHALRPGQPEIIGDVLAGRPVLAIMPTGAGKSLCYQLPAVHLGRDGGLTLVVSPLIALMKDQVDVLRARGVSTASLTSAATPEEQSEILSGIRAGEYDLLYVAPERFYSGRFLDALAAVGDRLGLLAIDEAHCISEWGHEFRPAYRLLGQVLRKLRPPRIIAATATATRSVQADIVEQLGLVDAALHVHGFARDNLDLCVHHTGGPKAKATLLAELVARVDGGSIIVYAATRKNTERYAAALQEAGHDAGVYHAGLSDRARRDVQEAFMESRIRTIVATNAFGMGVDKTDIRLVVHADVPRSVEAYYQEAGRAGRDGLPAQCALLFNHGDVRVQEFLIDAAYPGAAVLRGVWSALRAAPGAADATAIRAELSDPPHVSVVESALRILARHGFVADGGGALQAVRPEDVGGDFPPFDPESFERRAEVERRKLGQMIDYAYHTRCRHEYLLDYFGDPDSASDRECERCDNCTGRGSTESLASDERSEAAALLELVRDLRGRFGRTRIAQVARGDDDDPRFAELPGRACLRGKSASHAMALLRALEAAGLVSQSGGDYPTIALTRAGVDVASGARELDAFELRTPRRRSARKSRAPLGAVGPADPVLVESLRALRARLAGDREVPPYVIFSNRTLDDLARRKPRSLAELSQVHGIGPSRLEEFGTAILEVVEGGP